MERQTKPARRILNALALALLLFLLPAALPGSTRLGSAWAQDDGAYRVLYESGPAGDWELNVEGPEEWWRVEQEGRTDNDVLHGLGHVFTRYTGGEWENYRLHCRVLLLNEPAIHLNVRQSDRGRYYISFAPWGMALNKESPWGTHSDDLNEYGDPRAHATGRWYTIDIVVDGQNIEAFVDGTMEVGYGDPNPLPSGGVSFETLENGDALVDEVGVEVFDRPSSPDLAILAADRWEVSRDRRELVIHVEIANHGDAQSSGTHVWVGEEARGWDTQVTVRPLAPGEETVVRVRLDVDDRQRGLEHVFGVYVDPENRIPDDPNRENNWAQTPRIEIEQDPTPTPRPITRTPTRTRTPRPRRITSTPTRTRTPRPQRITSTPTRTRTPTPRPPKITPTPPNGRGGGFDIKEWFWVATTLLLSGASFAVGRNLGIKTKLLWTDKGHIQWHVEAQTKLPEKKVPCKWACTVNAGANLLDRWQLEALELTSAMRLRRGKTPPPKRVEGAVLKPLDSLANIASVWHRPETVRKRLAPVVDALLKEVLSWEKEGQTPPSIRLDAYLKAPISAQFKLYHCQPSLKGLKWIEWFKWKTKVNQPAGEFVGIFRGPTAGEADFAARARQELEACLMDLVRVVRFRL